MGTEACNPNSAEKYAMVVFVKSAWCVPVQLFLLARYSSNSRNTAEYWRRNEGSSAKRANRSDLISDKSLTGLWFVRNHRVGSITSNSWRASNVQLHQRFCASSGSRWRFCGSELFTILGESTSTPLVKITHSVSAMTGDHRLRSGVPCFMPRGPLFGECHGGVPFAKDFCDPVE